MLNCAVIMGRLTADPELRTTTTGKSVCSFSIAVDRSFARAGEQVELKKALINIYEMEILDLQMPFMKIRVRCSKGTYIRSLAHEIGQAVGSGAYLRSLRRTRSGGFTVDNAWDLQNFLEKLKSAETK